MNNKIYVPDLEGKCYEFIDRHTIRVYTDNFAYNRNIPYYDLYLDSQYYKTQTNNAWYWYNDQYNHATFPSCIDRNNLTDSIYYRNDFDSILIIFFILTIVLLYIPTRVVLRMLGRWGKW